MAKDKSKTKASNDDFAKPSESKGGGDGWNMTEEAEGRLLLITPLREDEAETKEYGTKPVTICDVVVINEKKPEKSEEHTGVYAWGGYLRGSLHSYVGERQVLGRLVKGKTKERGNYPWLLEDADDDDIKAAIAYKESVDPFAVKGSKSKAKPADDDEDDEPKAKKKKAKKKKAKK